MHIMPSGNNLTGFASHFAKQFLLDAKQLQNIVAENCDAIRLSVFAGTLLSVNARDIAIDDERLRTRTNEMSAQRTQPASGRGVILY